jgi:TrmH family RNA methyltransferase
VHTVVISPDLLRSERARQSAAELERAGARRLLLSAEVFKSIAARENPQGIAIVCPKRFPCLSEAEPATGLCWIALRRPQDPGNVGAVLRTTEAVGGAGVILLDDSVDPYDPRCVRASMGAVFCTPIVRAATAELVEWVSTTGCFLVAVTGDAVDDYRSLQYRRPLTLVMGSEREGIEEGIEYHAAVSIPIVGRADSLNLAVASGIALYEVFRQLGADSKAVKPSTGRRS